MLLCVWRGNSNEYNQYAIIVQKINKKFYLNLSIISQDIDIERISFLPINQGQ